MAVTKRSFGIIVSSLLCAGTLIAAVACGDRNEPEAEKYSVTYLAGATDAVGSVPAESYEVGTPITLRDVDTFSREGYTFTQWSDGSKLWSAGDTFFMPANDVTFTAQWEAIPAQSLPEGATSETVESILQGSLVTSNGTARANWFADYTDDGLTISAWVQDSFVYTNGSIYANDGIEVIFAKTQSEGNYNENTISVCVSANGETLVKNLGTGAAATIEGLQASAKYLTIDGATVAGYLVEITMPYSAADISKEDKNAAVALAITNASNGVNANTVWETSFGTVASKVNTYIAVKDKDTFTDNLYKHTVLDYLFIGASTLTPSSNWYTYEATFGNLKAENLSVPGSRVEYWVDKLDELGEKYAPEKIIMHIGMNNINDANESDEQVEERLTTLFGGLHEKFPEAELYYISIIPSVLFSANADTTKSVNTWASAQAEETDYLTFIDVASKMPNSETNMVWFGKDGLHLSVDGYGIFHREIAKALDLSYNETAGALGDMTAENAPEYGHTAGWVAEANDIWHNEKTGDGIAKLYISGAYGADVYGEAKISIKGMYNGEAFGKAGLAISSPTGTYFFYINLSNSANPNGFKDNWGSLAYRVETKDSKDWVFPETDLGGGNFFRPFGGNGYINFGAGNYDYNVSSEDYKTLAVAKVGKTLYFFSGGVQIGTLENCMFGANEAVTISVLNFNTDMYAKDGIAIVGTDAVNAKLQSINDVNSPLKTMDGSLADWTAQDKSNPVIFTGVEGRGVTIYATMDEHGINVYYDAYHKNNPTGNNNWWENTNIEFFVGASGNKQYYATKSNGATLTHYYFETTEENGMFHTIAEAFVPYSEIEGYDGNSAYIPVGFAFKTGERGGNVPYINDDYWKTDTLNPVDLRTTLVTKNGIKKNVGTARTIDGDATDWGTLTEVAGTKAGATAKYATLLASDGMYVILQVTATNINVDKTDSSSWHLNTNLELLGGGSHYTGRIVTFGGKLYYSGCVDNAAMTISEDKSTLTIEFFIANEHLKNVTSDTESAVLDLGGQLYADSVSDTWQEYALKKTVTRQTEE